MTISLIRRAIVCAGTVALGISLVGQIAMADGDDNESTKLKVVRCNTGASIQKKVDKAKHGTPTTIVIKGTCTEEVTVGKDDLTLLAHEDGGSVDGSISVIGAQRVTIDGLNVVSVSALDNASVTINDATIESGGLTALRSAVVVMENTTVEATGEFTCAVFISDGSVFRMNGGNTLSNEAPSLNCATLSVYRNSTARIRGSGNTSHKRRAYPNHWI